MDDLPVLRARIPGYADYSGTETRHQTDKQIRAYLGEALSEARERLKPPAPIADQLDGLVLRCEFSDQRFIRAVDHARFGDALAERVHRLDRIIVDAADRVRAVASVDELARILDEAAQSLDERFGAVADAPV